MKIVYSKKAADKNEFSRYFMISLADASVKNAGFNGTYSLPVVGNGNASIFYTTSKFMSEAKRVGSESHRCLQFIMRRFADSTLIVCE